MIDDFGRDKYIFAVPSGIGDISWLYSKLKNIPEVASSEMKMEILIADGWPYRALPFVKLLSQVSHVDYGAHIYEDIVKFEKFHEIDHKKLTWEQLKKKGFGVYFIQNNHFLEEGIRLEKWCPDLDCDFFYPLSTSEEDSNVAARLLSTCDRSPIVGIFGSSKRGAKLWNGWMAEEWYQFILSLHNQYGCQFALMGAQWDHEIMDEIEYMLKENKVPYINIVGKTTISVVIEVLQRLDYFACFSSGLNVLATLTRTPCCAMWPEFQEGLKYSWAPTELIDSGDYRAYTWTEPKTVYKSIKGILDNKLSW